MADKISLSEKRFDQRRIYDLTIYRNSAWGRDKAIEVSFQVLDTKTCCFQGNGKVEGIIGWGLTQFEAAHNLIERLREHDGFTTS